MEILRFLESIRTNIGDIFFSTVTQLGEETLFIILGIIFFWCINKYEGYYLLCIGFLGTIINQFLKITCRIPRPWVKDKSFTIVESARAGATGYSFPSGHTQSSVGIFGGIARWQKNKIIRIICVAIAVLVPISRMYLGVHTPLDVGVSVISALLLIFVLHPLVEKSVEKPFLLRILFAVMTLLSLGYLLYVNLYNFPSDIDLHNYESALKNGYKMFGCTLAIWLSYEVDVRFTHFETKATLPAQILKLVLGLIPVILIKTFLKAPLIALIDNSYIADGVRYFLLAAFAGCIWPMTFKWFSKLFLKKDK